ncbi:hypothetical protein Pcac1_g19678 [Phytophthora cactorum]|nr:hypothetical protein Pcac1_g19678 [Phytophthora cactorum]
MDLSNATAAGHQQRNNSSVRVSDADTPDTMRVSAQRLCTRPGGDVSMPGIAAIK